MKTIALSLLLIFASFTVVLSTYYLWQDSDFQVSMPIEEEEDHSSNNKVSFKAEFLTTRLILSLLEQENSRAIQNLDINSNYEDVYLNTPYSPPDMMC
jgi:hypothetical protein